MQGIYYFSSGVWLSLLLSASINLRSELILIGLHKLRYVRNNLLKQTHIDGAQFREMLLYNKPSKDGKLHKKCATLFGHAGFSCWSNLVVIVLCLIGGCLLYFVQFQPLAAQDLIGSTAHIVDLLNNKTDSEYKTITLWQSILDFNSHGGTDAFLQKDLLIFTVAGPFTLLFFTFIGAVLPLPKAAHFAIAKIANLGFTFSGIEVLTFAMLLCTLVLKSQTANLIEINNAPMYLCKALDHIYGIGSEPCFYINLFLLFPAFIALPTLFMLSALLNWFVHHATRRCYSTSLSCNEF
jgi:hypothetical protein